jgi:AcrR family transcriptional regulator
MRTVKTHDERRNEILDAAWGLLTSRGYEGTTVAALIDYLGIAKGTFYHYFRSKEQVLDAIAERLSAEPRAELQQVVDDAGLDAETKLNRFLEVARSSRLRRVDSVLRVARVLYRDENLVIRHKMGEHMARLMVPVLGTIIHQGMDEGRFQVSDAGEAARFFWALSSIFADQQMQSMLEDGPVEQRVDEMHRRAEFVVQSLERVLGAREGSIASPPRRMLELFVRAADAAETGGGGSEAIRGPVGPGEETR